MKVVNYQNHLDVQSSGDHVSLRYSVIAKTLNHQLVRLDADEHVDSVKYFKTLWVADLKLLFTLLTKQTLYTVEPV